MTIKDWLTKQGKPQRWLAFEMKCDQGRISKLVNGKVMPTAKTIALAEKITKGAVSYNDWFNAWAGPRTGIKRAKSKSEVSR